VVLIPECVHSLVARSGVPKKGKRVETKKKDCEHRPVRDSMVDEPAGTYAKASPRPRPDHASVDAVSDQAPPPEWLEAANCLSTVAHQIASVAHEANNLLQVISGNAEMLETGRDTTEQLIRRAQVIGDHARRTSALLSSVLELSREDLARIETLDLRETAQRSLDLRKYALAKARIAVTFECADGVLRVRANRRRTLQILLNLLMNAERALSGRDSPRLLVRVARDQDQISLSVEDNGPGVGGALAQAVGPAPPVLGIGLRVANWLALAQSGTLQITAAPSAGTVATLRLPAD
jgi:signal transduction histidine kinase